MQTRVWLFINACKAQTGFQMTELFFSFTPGSLHIVSCAAGIILSFEICVTSSQVSYHLSCGGWHSPQLSGALQGCLHALSLFGCGLPLHLDPPSQSPAAAWPSHPHQPSAEAQAFSWTSPKSVGIRLSVCGSTFYWTLGETNSIQFTETKTLQNIATDIPVLKSPPQSLRHQVSLATFPLKI